MKLTEYVQVSAILRLKGGLHIGSATARDVGKGEPLPVMKSLLKDLPYIPGSSLKGKMRSLLEITYGKLAILEKCQCENCKKQLPSHPCNCGECQICLLFGSSEAKTTFEPSRLIFRDCSLTEDSARRIEKIGLENKPGVSIDRQTGKARSGALFPMERIPEGTEFNFQISCRVFENDDKEAIKKWLAIGLFLLEQDTLGGGGTRGSGYIEFDEIKFDNQSFDANWRENCKKIKNELLGKCLIIKNTK